MDFNEYIKTGMQGEMVVQVEEQHSAEHVGSGSMRVLATPMMIAFMEQTARDLLARLLPQGYSSVGVHVDVRHLAPTPLGCAVRIVCEIIEVDGSKILFSVQAWDPVEQVGSGNHQRVIINEERFLNRVKTKGSTTGAGRSG